jgi:ATP-binding cassette, subfamily A (ABC1), member 3
MSIMEELKGEKIEIEDDEEDVTSRAGGSGAKAGGSSVAQVEKRSMKCFTDYTINGPTLEEVFMNVARESGITGEV